MSDETAYQALGFGASGISGYAIVKELLAYPTITTFNRIIGLTNRPLSKEAALLPEDDRIELVSGLDLTDRDQTFRHMKGIRGIEKTTHVYFAAYAGHWMDFDQLKKINSAMLHNAVDACEACCPGLKFFSLQTGGKMYGIEFIMEGAPYTPPFTESQPRLPEPWASKVFYYDQYEIMERASVGKPWKFCEVRPSGIVGFVPNNNAMNMAEEFGFFLALYKEINGEGAEVPYFSSPEGWEALHNDTSQDILARFHVHASLHPEKTHGRAFNVADGPGTTWKEYWPQLCKYFGLKAQPPSASGRQFEAAEWINAHRSRWPEVELKYQLKEGVFERTGFGFVGVAMRFPLSREYDLSESRAVGFTEERPQVEGYQLAFDGMKRAKIIP
ncbi:hypothetical protein LTR37_021076 [Vermiconidia calcicola]|uniref:Uncharacterized protein n=1 Tax=Vermiconidia calcicola TaxID=1690605 RepID=A0ACC3MBG5_9PEZI|nr:hypothetical protein LTR37_021076 [Vermiconidia calcicola]